MNPVLRTSRVLGLTVVLAVASLALLAPLLAAGAAKPRGASIYPDAGNPSDVAGVFKKCSRARFIGKELHLLADSTNGDWGLTVILRPFKGFDHHYVIGYGSSRGSQITVDQNGVEEFSTAFPPPVPVPHPAGSVRFARNGRVVGVATAPYNEAITDSVLVQGGMRCSVPSR
jgi:hypothetical protein